MCKWVGCFGLLFPHLLSEDRWVRGLQRLSLDFQESLAELIVVGLLAALFQVLHEAVSLQCSKCPMNYWVAHPGVLLLVSSESEIC